MSSDSFHKRVNFANIDGNSLGCDHYRDTTSERMIRWLSAILVFSAVLGTGCGKSAPMNAGSISTGYDGLVIPQARQPAGEDYVKGRRLLESSRNAYQAIRLYSGSIHLNATAMIGSHIHKEQRTLRVYYQRPLQLSLEGQNSNNVQFIIHSDGQTITAKLAGDHESFNSVADALYAFSGRTLYGSLVLPGCLLDISWANEEFHLPNDTTLLEALATKAQLIGAVEVDGNECYHILCERDMITWTIYLDQKTSLIRQADCEVTEQQMDRLIAIGLGGGASGNLRAIKRSQKFEIEKIVTDNPVLPGTEKVSGTNN